MQKNRRLRVGVAAGFSGLFAQGVVEGIVHGAGDVGEGPGGEFFDHEAVYMGKADGRAGDDAEICAGDKAAGVIVLGVPLHQYCLVAQRFGPFKAVFQQVFGDVLALEFGFDGHGGEDEQFCFVAAL